MFVAFAAFSSNAQLAGVEIDVYVEHDGVVGETDLTGFTTYRLYAVLTNENDFLSAIYGLAGEPLEITTTTSFYQNSFGTSLGSTINPGFYGFVPELEYDSWVTIGREDNLSAGTDIFTAQAAAEPWLDNFAAGGDIVMSGQIGGSWFTLFQGESVQAYPDANLRVLIGQFTTDGDITGFINAQVFVNGVQADDNNGVGFAFTSIEGAVLGCTDPEAVNYDPEATVESGLCTYPCTLELAEINITPPTCHNTNNASVQFVPSGQQGLVIYQLNGGNNLAVGNYNNLPAGDHTISITDSEGCQIVQEFTIVAPQPVTLAASLTSPITCNGAANGVISGTGNGGTGDITFSLSNQMTNPVDELLFENLTPGNYTIYAVDANGCAGQSSAISVVQPLNLNVGITAQVAADCANTPDGTIVAIASGGAGGTQFSIDNENFQTSNIFNVLPGQYTVYVQDQNGCTGQSNSQANIGGPDAITLSSTVTPPSCAGDENGAIMGSAAGGNGGFNYTVDGGVASNMLDLADLAAGTYEIVVTDEEGCTDTFQVDVVAPEAVEISGTASDILCNGDENGSIEVMGAGGTAPYTFTVNGEDQGVNNLFEGLASGDYSVAVIDNNGCTIATDFEITEPTSLSIDGSSTEESATGAGDAAVNVTVSGGTEPYTFEWSGPNGFSSDDQNLTGVSAGAYDVTVTDANGCEITFSTDVTVSITELGAGIAYSVYPNPSNGVFFLDIEGLNGQKVAYTILDASGRIIDRVELNAAQASFRETININGAASGVYFIQLTIGELTSTARIMKQN